MSFSKSNYRNNNNNNHKNNSIRNNFVYNNTNPNNDNIFYDKNKLGKNINDLNVCSGVFNVEKTTKEKKMNLIYSAGLTDLSKKGKHNQKSASAVTLNKSRYSKSARSNFTDENVSLKSVQRAQTTNQTRLKQQSSIKQILCQQCLKYHLDKCNLCYNESSMDDLETEYYYKNAIESSGYQQQKQHKFQERLLNNNKLKATAKTGPILNNTGVTQRRQHQPNSQAHTQTPKTTLFLTEINYSESNASMNNYYSVNKNKNFSHVTSSNDNKSISFSLPPTDLTSGNFEAENKLIDRQQSFNKSLLALVFKEKSGLDIKENVIESLMENDVIEVNNRSTPFPSSNPSYSYRNAADSRASTNTNTYKNQYLTDSTINNENISVSDSQAIRRTKSCDFLSKRRKTMLSLLNDSANESTISSKKDETSEYFFKNLKDLCRKLPKKEKQLKLVDIPVTKTSNKMFEAIDRFDVAKTYKTTNLSQKLSEFMKKESEEIRNTNRTILNGFISAKIDYNDDLNGESSQNYQSTDNVIDKKKKFNFDPPLTSIEQKKFIDSYRKQFELEI